MIGNLIKTQLQHAYCLCLPLLISTSTFLGVYLPAPSSFSLAFNHGDGQLHLVGSMRCPPITDINQYTPLQSQMYGMHVCMYVCMYACTYHSALVKKKCTYLYKRKKLSTSRFRALESSGLDLSKSLSNLSLHPLPFNSTGLSSVENSSLSVAAICSQSKGLLGRFAATSLAKSTSCHLRPTKTRHSGTAHA